MAALDLALPFLADLRERAAAAGVAERVLPVCADIADPPLAPASLDLLWSEGAAYAVGFEAALRAWRPLLAPAGRAVVSEMTWFAASPADEARAYWQAAYPGMADEATSRARAEAAGFRVLEVVRLPAEAWWTSYYGPLAERIAGLGPDERERLAGAVAETEAEIGLFERHGGDYGYAFHVLAVA